ILHVVDVLLHPTTCVEADQSLFQPVRTFTARDAPPATLMLVKLHGAQSKLHHTLRVVDYDYSARAQHRSSLSDRIEIHIDVDLISSKAGSGRSARHHRFQLPSVRNTATHFINHLLQAVSHRQFVDSRLRHIAAQAEQPRAAILRRTNLGVPLGATQHDGSTAGQCLRIIIYRSPTPHPNHPNEARPNARTPTP